jgi:hypothetical protein
MKPRLVLTGKCITNYDETRANAVLTALNLYRLPGVCWIRFGTNLYCYRVIPAGAKYPLTQAQD